MYKITKTTDEISKFRKYLTELLAFDTFQVPLYTTVLTVGSLASNLSKGEFRVDFDKVKRGTEILFIISPLVAPTMGLYIEGVRRLFSLKSAPRKSRDSLEKALIGGEENPTSQSQSEKFK